MSSRATTPVDELAAEILGRPQSPIAYSPTEAARTIGISRSGLYDRLASGEIPARKLGGRTIILHDDLVRYLQSLPTYEAVGGDKVA